MDGARENKFAHYFGCGRTWVEPTTMGVGGVDVLIVILVTWASNKIQPRNHLQSNLKFQITSWAIGLGVDHRIVIYTWWLTSTLQSASSYPWICWNLNLWDLNVPSYCSMNVEHPSSFSICQWISFDEDYVIDKWRSNMIYTQRPSPDNFACNWAGEKVSRMRESEFFFCLWDALPLRSQGRKRPFGVMLIKWNTQVEWMESLKISNIVLKFRVHLDSTIIIVSNCFFSFLKKGLGGQNYHWTSLKGKIDHRWNNARMKNTYPSVQVGVHLGTANPSALGYTLVFRLKHI
jgi:hypothetical protein